MVLREPVLGATRSRYRTRACCYALATRCPIADATDNFSPAGTALACIVLHELPGVQYCASVYCYAPATRCAVLSSRMLLPELAAIINEGPNPPYPNPPYPNPPYPNPPYPPMCATSYVCSTDIAYRHTP
eukprot:1666336-Rhodomonas_salina.1